MDDKYKDIPFDELRNQQRAIAAAIAQRRTERLQTLQEEIATLGFTVDDLFPRKPKGTHSRPTQRRYRDPNNPDNTWGGKGPKPQWLKDAIEAGHNLDAFVSAT